MQSRKYPWGPSRREERGFGSVGSKIDACSSPAGLEISPALERSSRTSGMRLEIRLARQRGCDPGQQGVPGIGKQRWGPASVSPMSAPAR